MVITKKEKYFLKRKQLKIRMNKIAQYVGCSQSLISRYENNERGMTKEKIKRYREFIDNYKI
ncbi:helix-turn-helix domain-containing protein [Priestia sp. TGN 0903]|uniref:helix-turn-helix domain-containing protein n=1 Tax=Priestia sp. TGN 0903 TaxID=3420730 RepID=UPI003D76C1AA